jgi:hypothetical protein
MKFEGWLKNHVPEIHADLNGASGKWDIKVCYFPEHAEDSREITLSFDSFPSPEEIKVALDKL